MDDGEFNPNDPNHDLDGDGIWDGPALIEKAIFRDGSYWLTSQMYVDFEEFQDDFYFWQHYDQDPWNAYWDSNAKEEYGIIYTCPDFDEDDVCDIQDTDENGINDFYDSLYFLPDPESEELWAEGFVFGGSDKFFGTSTALTDETVSYTHLTLTTILLV